VTYPLDDLDGFREDVEAIVDAIGREAVAFGCMDEWALAYARADPEGVRLPFAGIDTLDDVLNKSELYATCETLGVPYPETYRLTETAEAATGTPDADATLDEAAEALGFPLVVKPELKRDFEEAFGTNVLEVADRKEFADAVAAAREEEIAVMAQKRVDIATRSRPLARVVRPALGRRGRARGRRQRRGAIPAAVRYLLSGGDGRRAGDRGARAGGARRRRLPRDQRGGVRVRRRARGVPPARRQHPTVEVDRDAGRAAGANLPMGGVRRRHRRRVRVVGRRADAGVYLRDYLALLAGDDVFWDQLSTADWRRLVAGDFEREGNLTTGIYRPSDPRAGREVVRDGVRRPRLLLLLLRAVGSASTAIRYLNSRERPRQSLIKNEVVASAKPPKQFVGEGAC